MVLIDEWSRPVYVLTLAIGGVNGCTRQCQEVGLRSRNIQRIVFLQRNDNSSVASLGNQVQAVVEELPENREQSSSRSRKPFIGRDVGNHEIGAGNQRIDQFIQR